MTVVAHHHTTFISYVCIYTRRWDDKSNINIHNEVIFDNSLSTSTSAASVWASLLLLDSEKERWYWFWVGGGSLWGCLWFFMMYQKLIKELFDLIFLLKDWKKYAKKSFPWCYLWRLYIKYLTYISIIHHIHVCSLSLNRIILYYISHGFLLSSYQSLLLRVNV